MIFRRIFDPKLAQTSYLIGCSSIREAIVVDPNREAGRYLAAATEDGLRITHVTETHIHADFVSGARELTHRTGALLHLSGAGGSEWGYRYPSEVSWSPLTDGSCIRVGRVQLQAMHLPGHTPEHLAFLVTDTARAAEPMGVLTGDFLFVGDVGRPDLLERAVQALGTMERSARELFQSLQKFAGLPDYVQIWPGHGAGSACGKSLSPMPQSTLGYEKRFNWAFGIRDEAEFVRAVLAGQPDPPRYFARMKRINQTGPKLLGEVTAPPRLNLGDLRRLLDTGAVVVDTRPADEFGRAAVPGTINLPADRSFTTWAGSLLPDDVDIYLVADDRSSLPEQLARDLAGIGLDRVAGYFPPGVVEAWKASGKQLQIVPAVSLEEFARDHAEDGTVVLDVRREGEWRAGHVPGSLNVPLGELQERLAQIPRDAMLMVHCQTGSRAAIGVSILLARGFPNVRLLSGGFASWRAAGQVVAVRP